jgi:hypothetical protein
VNLGGAKISPRTRAGYRIDLGLHALARGEAAGALLEVQGAMALLATLPEPAPATLARAQAAQGRALAALARAAEAEPLLRAALAGMEENPPDNREELAAVRRALGVEGAGTAPPAPTPTGLLVHGAAKP